MSLVSRVTPWDFAGGTKGSTLRQRSGNQQSGDLPTVDNDWFQIVNTVIVDDHTLSLIELICTVVINHQ